MLWTIVVLLLILWLLGFTMHVAGGLIHVLLGIALIVIVVRLLSGRRVLPRHWRGQTGPRRRTGDAPRPRGRPLPYSGRSLHTRGVTPEDRVPCGARRGCMDVYL